VSNVSLVMALDIIDHSEQYNLWLYHAVEPYLSGTVLDVGSGIGSIAQNFINNQSIKKVILSDADADFVSTLRERFGKYKNYSVIDLDISSLDAPNEALFDFCDTITCINVLEHIEDDMSTLRNLKVYLKKGGALVLMGPNFSWLYGSLDKSVGHHRRYDIKDLKDKIIRSGYFPEKIFYFNMAGIITWFIAGKILRKKIFPQKACKKLDKCVFLLEKIEKRIKPFFGQSIISICRL